ncbi:MAG: hypothetical protein ACYC35_12655 [Pirellulales bacterium]
MSASESPSDPTAPAVTGDAWIAEEGPESENEAVRSVWKCPNCGESVPGDFDVCWKCLLTREAGQVEDIGRPLAQVDEIDQESEAPVEDTETSEPEADNEEPRACSRCGSTKIISGLITVGNSLLLGSAKAVILGSPQALIFKEGLYSEVNANICGKCGHLELRVANPQALYERYQKSRGLDRPIDTRQFSSVPCQKCRMLMPKTSGTCPHCGASQVDF